MIKELLILGLISLSSCKDKNERNVAEKYKPKDTGKVFEPVDTALQTRIFDTLVKLSFIKESDRYIDSSTNHKHRISFLMDTLENEKLIYIQAGLNNEDRFVTGFQFYVNPKTMDIKVYDPVNDKRLSIKEFERHLKTLK